MAKYHRINWKESDTDALNKAVRNFNAKVRRLAKSNPTIASVLPEKVSAKELKELISTRQDLKREINALRRFTKRGAETLVDVPGSEYDLKITKWQRTEMLRRVAVINRRRKARLEKLQDTTLASRGESLGYKLGDIGMGTTTEMSLQPLNAFTKAMRRIDVKQKYITILKESQSDYLKKKDFQLRENYIKGLLQNYGEEDIKDVISQIRSMDINDFIDKFISEDDKMELVYPPNREQYEGYVSSLKATWIPNVQK